MNPDVGEATEELAVEYDGAPLSIGFNAKYVMDLLERASPAAQVEMGFNDEVSPGCAQRHGPGLRVCRDADAALTPK